MVDFLKISEGPWEKTFDGQFESYPLEIYANQDSTILVAIIEKNGEESTGAILQAYRIYSAVGDLQSFVETLPRELIFFGKHDQNETIKFLAIGAGPIYAPINDENFYPKVDELLKKSKASSGLLTDVSKAYQVELKALANSPENVRQAFFSQPLMIPLLSTAGHGTFLSSNKSGTMESGNKSSFVTGQMLLGLQKDNQKMAEESISDFLRTMIVDGQENDRRLVMHILIEGTLLSNCAAVVWDASNQYSMLSIPNQDPKNMKVAGLDIEPAGFPVKTFKPFDDLQVNLKAIPIDGLFELLGAGKQTHIKQLAITAQQQNIKSIPEWIEEIKKIPTNDEFTGYFAGKAIRTLNLIQYRYPKLFDGPNNMEEISKNWVRAIGRLGQIDAKSLDSRQQVLFMSSLIAEMKNHYQKQGTSKQVRSVLFLPEFFKRADHAQSIIVKKMLEDLLQLKEFGVGFVISSPHEIDLDDNLRANMDANLTVVSQKDVGVSLKNKKQYRVILRPTLSQYLE